VEIAIVTDELSADPETAFEIGLEEGVRRFELRGVHSDRIPRISAHAKARLIRAIRDFGVEITAVSPGLFKIPLPDVAPQRSNLGWMDAGFFRQWQDSQAALRDHVDDLLPRTIDFAGEVCARYIVGFSFHRAGAAGGPAPAQAIDQLGAAADRVRAAGLEFLIETEEGFWADTGARSAAVVAAVGAERAGINWDPANSFCEDDDPFPAGYAAVRPYVRNVHFKDARRDAQGRATFVADGEIDWRGQIAALARDGYSGAIAIEPHLERPVAAVRHSLKRLRSLIADATTT
jgi:sugar phosphate isomerase/epimerase